MPVSSSQEFGTVTLVTGGTSVFSDVTPYVFLPKGHAWPLMITVLPNPQVLKNSVSNHEVGL